MIGAFHGPGFPRSCLTICKDRAIVTKDESLNKERGTLDDRNGNFLVDLQLLRDGAEYFIKGEIILILVASYLDDE